MKAEHLAELQATRGGVSKNKDQVTKKYDAVKEDCRDYIIEQNDKEGMVKRGYNKESAKKYIVQYVMKVSPLVEGFVENGEIKTNDLINKLAEDLTDRGKLTTPIEDDSVYEIQVNGRDILIEQGGRVKRLRDKSGKIIRFESPEEQQIIISRLLGDVRFNPKDCIVSSRTIEGYRMEAIHSSGLGKDPSNDKNDGYSAFVLRKFKKDKYKLGELVKKKTLSDNMARFLSLLPRGDISFSTWGPTRTGKSTTNNAILLSTPLDKRVILLQNPSEIDLRITDSEGNIINNVLHLEAKDIENPSSKDPTMTNLEYAILRLSPQLVCFGEMRTNSEIALGLQIAEAGNVINLTGHAMTSEGAMQRCATACNAETGEPTEVIISKWCGVMDVLIVQHIMADGTRKIVQISEVIGVSENEPTKAEIVDLYRFKEHGQVVFDENGDVAELGGSHHRVNKISERIVSKFRGAGIPKKYYSFLTEEVTEDEEETYTGEDIDIVLKGGAEEL